MNARSLPLFTLLVVLALLTACDGAPAPTATSPAAPPPPSTDAEPVTAPVALPPAGREGYGWWNETVWYEIYVRSFHDSDGDGVGDLRGLIGKLDYLNDGDPATGDDLGVTGIWLMPITASAGDEGFDFDVVDYRAVDDQYGTVADFRELMREAHARGIRVVVDLVLNHTSTRHPWFEAARAGDPTYADWYRFMEGPPPPRRSPWNGGDLWHPADEDRHYYGLFWSELPDLNHANPEVRAEIYDISRFWLEEMGVDGFRLDAIRYLVESGDSLEDTAETHAWLADYRRYVKSIAPDAFLFGDIYTAVDRLAPYVADGELDAVMEPYAAETLRAAAALENAGPVRAAFGFGERRYPPQRTLLFLGKHDVERTASVLDGDENHARVAAALLLTAPAIPLFLYGEEIGMEGRKPDEDIRRPMAWNGEATGGFSAGTPWRPLPPDHAARNVAALRGDPDSLLSHYRRLIALRNDHPALRVGDYALVESGSHALFAFLRQSEGESLLVIHNLSGAPISDYALALEDAPLALAAGPAPELLHGLTVAPPALDGDGRFRDYRPLPTLEPYRSYVIQLRP